MSYWIYLTEAGEGSPTHSVEHHAEGGTYVLGGSDEACLNMTYNYGAHIRAAFDGLPFREAMHLKKAADALPLLKTAVEKLGTKRDENYWASTEGNAGYALSILRDWAQQHPQGIFLVH